MELFNHPQTAAVVIALRCLSVDEIDPETELGVDRLDDLLVGSSLIDGNTLALEVFDLFDACPLLGEDAVAGDEHGVEKIDLGLARQRVGRGRAIDVGGTVEQQRDACRADHRYELNVELI